MSNNVQHKSDCAKHNAPALPQGKCDCGAEIARLEAALSQTSALLDQYIKLYDAAYEREVAAASRIETLDAENKALREALHKIADGFWSTEAVDTIIAGNWRQALREVQTIARAALRPRGGR